MTAPLLDVEVDAPLADELPADAWDHPAPNRKRLLSYVGRWGRARRWLPRDAERIYDVGSAFGYGTAALTGHVGDRRRVVGIECDDAHLASAPQRYPWVPVLRGWAERLPGPDQSVDAVTLLDVIEHVADPEEVVAEIHRVLRPGGILVLTTPHKGLLERFDSLNLYPALRKRFPNWPPLDEADAAASGKHLHFSVDELRALLEPEFTIEEIELTGLGLAELVHLFGLIVLKGILGSQRLYHAIFPLHFSVYLLDDMVPWGKASFYVSVKARRTD
jgi:SAM-dependent methyltransferase